MSAPPNPNTHPPNSGQWDGHSHFTTNTVPSQAWDGTASFDAGRPTQTVSLLVWSMTLGAELTSCARTLYHTTQLSHRQHCRTTRSVSITVMGYRGIPYLPNRQALLLQACQIGMRTQTSAPCRIQMCVFHENHSHKTNHLSRSTIWGLLTKVPTHIGLRVRPISCPISLM